MDNLVELRGTVVAIEKSAEPRWIPDVREVIVNGGVWVNEYVFPLFHGSVQELQCLVVYYCHNRAATSFHGVAALQPRDEIQNAEDYQTGSDGSHNSVPDL